MKKIILALTLLSLTGCVTAGTVPVVNVSTGTPTVVDMKIQKAVAQVTRYCNEIKLVLSIVDMYVNSPTGRIIIDNARVVTDTTCSNPPSDVVTTLATLGQVYTNVIAVQKGKV